MVNRFVFVLIPVALAYVSLMNYFRATQRELKRLESVTRSPIFAHFSQTLGGLSTIRYVASFPLVRAHFLLARQCGCNPDFLHACMRARSLCDCRGYVQQERFTIQTEQLIDSYHEAYFSMKSADRWLSMHLEMLGNILVFANALLIVLLPVRVRVRPSTELQSLLTHFLCLSFGRSCRAWSRRELPASRCRLP